MRYIPGKPETRGGITWIELMLDFEMATRIFLVHHARTTQRNSASRITSVRDRARYFQESTRQLFNMCKGPKLPVGKTGSLYPFGRVATAGLPVRPALFSPMHVYVELAHQAMNHGNVLLGRQAGGSNHWLWPPIYLRPPKSDWEGGVVQPSIAPLHRIRGKQRVSEPLLVAASDWSGVAGSVLSTS